MVTAVHININIVIGMRHLTAKSTIQRSFIDQSFTVYFFSAREIHSLTFHAAKSVYGVG